MSDWTIHLEFDEGTSSKFWRARVEGKTLYVNYGKIGANGQTQVKDLGDPAAAQAEYDKLVREKRKKGYHDGTAGAAPAPSPDDAGDDEDADDDGEEADEEVTVLAKRPSGKSAAAAKAPAAKPAAAKPAAPSVPGHRMVLDAGSRKVETTLYLDGSSLRMDSHETYATPDAAKKAFERLKKMLAGEGYKDG